MSQQLEKEDQIRRYLLGELSEEEREQLEKRLLSDDDFYQQVLAVENELIYDFVCDDLTGQEEMSFRRHVLPVPEHREDIKFARALRKYIRENRPSVTETTPVAEARASWLEPFAMFFRRPVLGLSLATALLLAVALSVWTALQNRKLRNQITLLEAQKTPTPAPAQDLPEQLTAAQRRNMELADELRREQELRASVERDLEAAKQQPQRDSTSTTPPRMTIATVVSFLLTPGASRDAGGEVKKISIPRGARAIRLQLDLAANNYRSYRVALKTVEGQKELLTKGMLRARPGARGASVWLSVPTQLLTRGDYQIQLSGETSTGQYEEIDAYYFRVAE